MDNVTHLEPRHHLSFDVWQTDDGYAAEALRNGTLVWEYRSDSLAKITAVIANTIGHLDD